ncbi:MAG: AI-2E family transporter [Chloroflexota bacterium]
MRSDLTPWTVRGMGLALGVLIVYGLVQLGAAASSILLLLFVSILLASALTPIIGSIRVHLPIGRGAAILVVYATFFIVVLGLAFIVVPAAIKQAEGIIASLPPFIAEVKAWAANLQPAALSRSVTALIESAAAFIRPAPPPDPDEVVEVGSAVLEAAVALGTVLVIVFFWILEHARLQRYALAFVPAEGRGGARDAWNEIESRLGMWVRGQLMLMGSIGVATSIVYTVLGLPGALLLGLIAGIAEAIPIVGPLIGAVPAILVAATISPELAVIVGLVYLVVQAVEGMVLIPLVMRNTVGISPLLVLVSLLIGGAVGGLVGAFLAVPLVASVEIVLSRLQARERRVAQDPAAIETPDGDASDELGRSLPDAANAGVD